MAKILISSLGTGRKEEGSYKKAKYRLDDKVYETSFIAKAIDEHINLDKIFLIGTIKSIWDEAYIVFDGDNSETHEELYDKKELGETTLALLKEIEKDTDFKIKPFLIDYGLNENEIWSNFEKFIKISKFIEDGDEIYLDITHSFRSLSLMSYVMTQFASSVSDKNFTVKAVYYGMYEYSYENKDGITPIVDIKILLELQDWIKSIEAIKRYGDFNALIELLEQDNSLEKQVKNTFVNLNNTINIANMSAMQQFIQTAHKKLNSIETSSNKIVKLLAPEIIKIIDELNYDKKSDFQFALAKWFFKNHNYALSYMALFEAVVTKTCELKEPNLDSSDKDVRDKIKGRVDYPYNIEFLENKDNKNENLDSLSSIRHSIVHQLDNRKDKVNQDIKKLSYFIDLFEKYFDK
ncbi:TIGR02221 family CRISPR-associated protein [Sulfurimonas sp. NW15]|uniref:TIGR02221 family CRISPR-associated protein n=1 Tax=Sulfurimonas sp. NW15 TaxID=2922729 RepID=UPI003DA8ED97